MPNENNKWNNYLFMAYILSLRSKCRSRKVGCLILNKEGRIISSGYNGPARRQEHCKVCNRKGHDSGKYLDECPAIHAEVNALINCGSLMNEAHTVVSTDSPCIPCLKMFLNTNIEEIRFMRMYPITKNKKLEIRKQTTNEDALTIRYNILRSKIDLIHHVDFEEELACSLATDGTVNEMLKYIEVTNES
jgi:dCMP deaminase